MPRVEPSDGTGMFLRRTPLPVDVKLDGDVYVATSPLVKGLLVVNKSREKLFEGVEKAMRDLTEYHLNEWYSQGEQQQ